MSNIRTLHIPCFIGLLMVSACSNSGNRPPPPTGTPGDPDVYYKVRCACDVQLSPETTAQLSTPGYTPPNPLPIDAHACLPIANDFSSATTYCSTTVANYVRREIEEILLQQTPGIADLTKPRADLCNAFPTVVIPSVSCAPVQFPTQDPAAPNQDFPALGVKLEPSCKDRVVNPPADIPCKFRSGGNCQLKAGDPGASFDCACNSVQGCDTVATSVIKPRSGNADDPPPVGSTTQGLVADLAFGLHNGTIDPALSHLNASVTLNLCVWTPFGDVCEDVSPSADSPLYGGFRVYGRPCPGASCQVAIEADAKANNLEFDFELLGVTLASHSVSNIRIFGGSGDLPVMVDASGNGQIPPGAFQYRVFYNDGGTEKESIGTLSQPIDFSIDWNQRSLTVNNTPIALGNAGGSFHLGGDFSESPLEAASQFCPKPGFATLDRAIAVGCSTDGQLAFTAPTVSLGCRDLTTTVTGSIIAVNGSVLGTPIPIVNGAAAAPRGTLKVRWVATDAWGRTASTEQIVDAVTRPALAAKESLDLGDRFSVTEASGAWGAVSNAGSLLSVLNTDGKVGEFDSVAAVTLRDRAKIFGVLISPKKPVLFNDTFIASTVVNTPAAVAWPSLPAPASSSTTIDVGGGIRTLAPGAYGAVTVRPSATLALTSGDYVFKSFDLESNAHLSIDKTGGAVRVLVQENPIILRGSYDHAPANATGFILGYTGQDTVYLETPFRGTVVVPNATLNLRSVEPQVHRGEFFGKRIRTEGGARVAHVPAACGS